MAKNWPKMAKNGRKWTENDLKWPKMGKMAENAGKGGFYTFRDRWRALLRGLVVNIAPNSANPSSLN